MKNVATYTPAERTINSSQTSTAPRTAIRARAICTNRGAGLSAAAAMALLNC